MRVTMLSTLPPVKGMSPYTLNLLKALTRRTCVDFIGFRRLYPEILYPGGTRTSDPEPEMEDLKISNILSWNNPFSWIRAGLSIRTSVLHAQWWAWPLAPLYIVIFLLARSKGVRILVTIHNVKPHEKSYLQNFLNRSVLCLAHAYLVHNENNKNMLIEVMSTSKPVYVVPMGIFQMNKPAMHRKALRKKYGLTDADKILLAFGNIRGYKGIDILIRSLPIFERDQRVHLIIAGKPWIDMEPHTRLIAENNLEEKVTLLLDFISDEQAAELFEIADLVVLPYREFEASSAVGALILNFGKAAVVTAVGGLPDLVDDPRVVAKPGDPVDLADKIRYALENQSSLEAAMNERRDHFSQDSVAYMHYQVYLELGAEP